MSHNCLYQAPVYFFQINSNVWFSSTDKKETVFAMARIIKYIT